METISQVQKEVIPTIISPENYQMSVQKWTEIIQELEGTLTKRTVFECGFCEEFKGEKDFDEEIGEYTQECENCPLFKAEMCVNNANSVPNEAAGYAFWEFNSAYNSWKYHGYVGIIKEEYRLTALRWARLLLEEIQKYNPNSTRVESSWDVL